MSKMYYFGNKFPRIAIFNIDDLQLRNLAKLCFSNRLWQNRTKNQLLRHFTSVTSLLLRHRKTLPN